MRDRSAECCHIRNLREVARKRLCKALFVDRGDGVVKALACGAEAAAGA